MFMCEDQLPMTQSERAAVATFERSRAKRSSTPGLDQCFPSQVRIISLSKAVHREETQKPASTGVVRGPRAWMRYRRADDDLQRPVVRSAGRGTYRSTGGRVMLALGGEEDAGNHLLVLRASDPRLLPHLLSVQTAGYRREDASDDALSHHTSRASHHRPISPSSASRPASRQGPERAPLETAPRQGGARPPSGDDMRSQAGDVYSGSRGGSRPGTAVTRPESARWALRADGGVETLTDQGNWPKEVDQYIHEVPLAARSPLGGWQSRPSSRGAAAPTTHRQEAVVALYRKSPVRGSPGRGSQVPMWEGQGVANDLLHSADTDEALAVPGSLRHGRVEPYRNRTAQRPPPPVHSNMPLAHHVFPSRKPSIQASRVYGATPHQVHVDSLVHSNGISEELMDTPIGGWNASTTLAVTGDGRGPYDSSATRGYREEQSWGASGAVNTGLDPRQGYRGIQRRMHESLRESDRALQLVHGADK